jgi:hypothetical protein
LADLIKLGRIQGILLSPLRIFRYLDQQVNLYHEQGADAVGVSGALSHATEIAITNGDLARGRIFAERAVSGWRTMGGGDSTEVIALEILARDPSKHLLYGLSMEWKTAVDEVPRGLESSDFEDWLWKREKPNYLGQLVVQVDLRSRASFPGFIDLPDESDSHPGLYEKSYMVTSRPQHRWCFLGEIVYFTTLHHLELRLKDIDDRKIPLHFYTPGLGSELTPAQVQRGYTVAVIHAQRRLFRFGDPGIRLEDLEMIKVRNNFQLMFTN